MIKRILIANRGEIACRIIRTVKAMGLTSIAIYSDEDRNSLHVKMADESVYIGESTASKSYLNIDKILHVIEQNNIDAVHPGYGFLSENAKFVQKLEESNIIFIGPSAQAIYSMGDKITSKRIAKESGVNIIPGYIEEIKTLDKAKERANEIGYPIMLKAVAGGGGKGIRAIYNEDEIEQAFSSTVNEARNSFNDGRIFIEKYIPSPRHIEVQILGDKHGNYVCLFERECSIQRNHQKIIEEAPSVFIDDKTRTEMYKQVISLARKVNYWSAGTVEFIIDQDKNFYFLEMNTRLQVEHCVTELITGLDLVEMMIKVANNEVMTLKQQDIRCNGWAIETRIYAEDPSNGFLPSSGRITKYIEPIQDNIRIDTGVYQGTNVSMFYDPMIAKLCAFGKDRQQAIDTLQVALGQFVIRGIAT